MKLSKVLSLVLAIAMLLSVPTFAYTDVAADANYSEAVTVLSALNIFTGYEDGTFKPEGKITRAEYAAIVCRVNNMEHAAKANKVGGIFTDVAADHWASGYIATAAQAGIVNGMGDGTFKPEAEVTYEQAVKMLVAALGYELKAQTLGGYPTGYMMIANQESITVGTTNTVGGASRGTVAQLTYNSLTVPLMEQDTWGTEEYIRPQYDESLLWTKLNAIKADVVFSDVSLKKSEVTTPVNYTSADVDVVTQYNWQEVKEFNPMSSVKINGVDLTGLQGLKVTAIIDISDVNDHKLVCVVPKANKNVEVTVNPKLLANVQNGEYVEYYKTNDDEKVSKLKIATDNKGNADVATYVNLEVGSYTKNVVAGGNTNDVAYRFVDTDNDGDFDTVFVDREQVFVVSTVNTTNGKIFRDTSATAGATYKQASVTLDTNDVTLDWSIKDTEGNAMELADIEEGAIVALRTSAKPSGTFHEIIISNETAEGTILERYPDKTKVNKVPFTTFTVGDKNFTLLDEANMTAPELGDEIIAKVYGDKIVAYDVAEGIRNYGLIIATDSDNVYGEDVYTVQMLTQKGEIVSVKLAGKVNEIDTTSGYSLALRNGDLIAYALNKDGELKAYDDVAPATGKSGNVVPMGTKFDGNGVKDAEYKATSGRLESYYITEDTVIFVTGDQEAVKDKTGAIKDWVYKADAMAMGSVDFLDEDTKYHFSVIADSNKEAKAVVLYAAQSAIDYTAKPFVIVKTSTITVEGDKRTKLSGYVNGEEASIILSDNMKTGLKADNFKVGDIILYSTNAAGDLYDAKWLVNKNKDGSFTVADTSRTKDKAGDLVKDDNDELIDYDTIKLDTAAFKELSKTEDLSATNAQTLAATRITEDTAKFGTIKGYGIAGAAYRVQGGFARLLNVDNYKTTFTTTGRDYDTVKDSGNEKLITDVSVNANEIAYYYNARTEKYKITSIADAENDYVNADYNVKGQMTNDDLVYVYNFDGTTNLILIVDVNGDNY